MTKLKKLLTRFKSRPSDFTFRELIKLLNSFGYQEIKSGKTSGSRVRFENKKKHTLLIHKPHPSPIVKRYVIVYIINELTKEGLI